MNYTSIMIGKAGIGHIRKKNLRQEMVAFGLVASAIKNGLTISIFAVVGVFTNN